MKVRAAISLLSGLLALLPPFILAERTPIVIDTDIGTGIEDAFALGWALGCEELELRGVITVGDPAQKKAMMVCRFLTMTGRRHTRVAVGADPQPPRPITDQYKYLHHPDPLFDRTSKPVKESAAEFLHARLKAQPGELTLVSLGPLTNVAELLENHADAAKAIRRLVLLESNLAHDLEAARKVFAAELPLLVVSEDASRGLVLDQAQVKRVFSPGTPLTRQVETLFQMWDRESPALSEVLAVALCFEQRYSTIERRAAVIDDAGKLRLGGAGPTVEVVTEIETGEFVNWFAARMESLVSPALHPVKQVERGGMPRRVHVAEDYETDIERRWWMSGKPETNLLPAGTGSKRACRSVLTHDFDDLLMVSRQMYPAVIFNPVPGPPMGGKTRLAFRYRLQGTDRIRVQIYSLSNGYHRQLVLDGLPQESWQEATVDMTQARRPDGTGGPLARDERIDDIQFYVAPDAEVIVDDVVLFEPAEEGETRPFPKRVIFTGWFDTGGLGKEWPGSFELVPDAGNFWKAARSVAHPETGDPWIRIGLRGERRLAATTQLSFRYKLTGADRLRVRLLNSQTGKHNEVEVPGMKNNQWAEVSVRFATGKLESVDELHLLLSKGAQLLADDLLLFEPGDEAN